MSSSRIGLNLLRLDYLNRESNISKNSIISDSTIINNPYFWITLFYNYWIDSTEDHIGIYNIVYYADDGIKSGLGRTLIVNSDGLTDGEYKSELLREIDRNILLIINNQYGSRRLYDQGSTIFEIVRSELLQL